MSLKQPPANGRVQSIKSKFENLSALESLETSGPIVRKVARPAFQRSATAFNLLSHRKEVKEVKESITCKSSHSKENNRPLPARQSRSDSAITKCTSPSSARASIRLRKEAASDAVEVRLSRHTSDPIKRGSIKRSPAFRIGDKLSKSVSLNKNTTTLHEGRPKTKFDEFVLKYTQAGVLNQKDVSMVTDTIKAILRQPLPSGPPPKKPPRTFDSSVKEDIASVNLFAQHFSEERKEQDNISVLDEVKNTISKTGNIRDNKLFECLSCQSDDPIYDAVSAEAPMSALNKKLIDELNARGYPNGTGNDEHIYAEPYGHLLTDTASGSSTPPSDRNMSNCSDCLCPEAHPISNDLHYLCTSINDRNNTNTMLGGDHCSNSTVNSVNVDGTDGIVSLDNTYDEINQLVNAAFNKEVRDSGHYSMADNATVNDNTIAADIEGPTHIVKLARSVTENRKEYVRRISEKGVTMNSPYGTLNRTFKSTMITTFSLPNEKRSCDNLEQEMPIKTTEDRINKYQQLVATNNSPTTSAAQLFHMCLLIGFNASTNQSYIKSKFPIDVESPKNIEQLIFPSKEIIHHTKDNQDYSLLLTDDSGMQLFGYCRRVFPENSEISLPLAYCLISATRAPGFFFKVLREIESRHGHSDLVMNNLLKQLWVRPIPSAGKFLYLKLLGSPPTKIVNKTPPNRLSLDTNPRWLTESDHMPPIDLINRSLIPKSRDRGDEILIRRPTDLRLESPELSDLYETLGAENLLTVFGTLLLERKVILYSRNISLLSSCVFGLQAILYPFRWQFICVSVIPDHLMEIVQAPFPVLAGVMIPITAEIEDGILVDLDQNIILQSCGDELTLLPENLRSSLLISLEMVNLIDQGKMLSSVLIAEAFLRFFIELLCTIKDEHIFSKETFIQSHSRASVRHFLEWFVETTLFRHFLNAKINVTKETKTTGDNNNTLNISDKNFFTVYDARLLERSQYKSTMSTQNIEKIMKNCKIVNKKVKTLKDRFKDFLSNNNNGN